MKTKILRTLASFSALTISLLSAPGVFAANPYSIVYEGGEPLSASNVQIEPEMINELTPILRNDIEGIDFYSGSYDWLDGYFYTSSRHCHKGKYIRVWKNDLISTDSGIGYIMRTNLYDVDVDINRVTLDNLEETGEGDEAYTIFVNERDGGVAVGYSIYSDESCTSQSRVSNVKRLNLEHGGTIFTEFNIKIRQKNNKPLVSDQLYFGLLDIDAHESSKILNQDSKLTPENMYAKSESGLQSSGGGICNLYVSENNYIYALGCDIVGGNSVFVKLGANTQLDGVDIVHGFQSSASSGIAYYIREYNVTYTSDSNGVIVGDDTEIVVSGNPPSGAEAEAKKGYELKYWTADKDVKLSDGKTIAAGKPILASQLKQVVVNSDIAFTAIHGLPEPEKEESLIAVPNTGSSTSETNAALVSISVFGVLLGALMIGILPKLHHKKVNFKQ